MTTQEKQRIDGEKIVNLIANSFFEDMYSWTQAKAINCYAFARGLTCPDVKNQIYTPGRLYRLKFGHGPEVNWKCDPYLIDKCISNDSLALNQHCERVSFSSIKEDDCNFYFAITEFHVLNSPADHHWHFICRTPNGLWLHKPDWFLAAELVNWIEYGKTFQFNTVGRELGSSFTECDESVLIPCEAVCFENFFYKLELPED